VRIELASTDDWAAIQALDVRDRAESLRSWIARGECLVARAESGEIVGFAVANSSFFEQCFIVLVVVRADQRRRGMASALIRAVEERSATAKIFTSTNQSNTAMQALCERLGYVRSGLVDNLDEGDPELIYFKRVR
jgi:ribosomal protein S18 acetylase RimI-like enzyme